MMEAFHGMKSSVQEVTASSYAHLYALGVTCSDSWSFLVSCRQVIQEGFNFDGGHSAYFRMQLF